MTIQFKESIMRSCLPFLIICALLPACQGGKEGDGKQRGGTPKVRFITLDATTEKRTLEALGSLVYFEKADVGSNVEGRIDAIYVAEGANVWRGQTLARVEQLPFTLALANAKTELAQAKNRLEMARNAYEDSVKNVMKQLAAIRRAWAELYDKELVLKSVTSKMSNTEALYRAGGATKVQYDEAVNAFSSANVAVTLAKNNLESIEIGYRESDLEALGYKGPFTIDQRQALLVKINTMKEKASISGAENEVLKAQNALQQAELLFQETVLKSPLTGIVAMKGIERGEAVKKDTKCFTVMDVSRMIANLSVSEDDVARIRKTGLVTLTIDALEKRRITGTVDLVHPLVDPRTRSVTVRVLVGNGDRALKPGMFARGEFALVEAAQAWLVPVDAVLEKKDNQGVVYVLNDKAVFKTPVTTGSVKGDMIEVLKGLRQGQLVAVPPKGSDEHDLSQLGDGMAVLPVLPEGMTNQAATNKRPRGK